MQIPKRLIDCLTEKNVLYEILHHREAFTAKRIADAEHVKAEHHAMATWIGTVNLADAGVGDAYGATYFG